MSSDAMSYSYLKTEQYKSVIDTCNQGRNYYYFKMLNHFRQQ